MIEQGQERRPIINNLFPVSKESVLTAFSSLSLKTNPSAQVEASQEMETFAATNPVVSNYFIQMLREFPSKEDTGQIFLGILVCHRALREEAKSKGLELPKLKQKFVQKYAKMREENILKTSEENKITIPEAAKQLGRLEIISFENSERDFSAIIGRNSDSQSGWGREQELRYLGIINLYFLFRKGFGDPKNFQERT